MDFRQAIISGYHNYVNFDDRASRSAYWYFVLFAILVQLVLRIIDGSLGLSSSQGVHMLGSGPLEVFWGLVVFLPRLSVGVRRLHDINKSGWWLLLMLIPIIGWIILIIWHATKGTVGDNRFGADPLATA